MELITCSSNAADAEVRVSHFTGTNGADEYHLTILPTRCATIEKQLDVIAAAYQSILQFAGLSEDTAVFRRFFCNDLINQQSALQNHAISSQPPQDACCSVSWTEQSPTSPGKVAMWAYHIKAPAGSLNKSGLGEHFAIRRGALTHHWTTGLTAPDANNVYDQTHAILQRYLSKLQDNHMTLADHVIRTWFFLRNIDQDYGDMVAARRDLFNRHGLTPQTHFIASTGIGGSGADIASRVMMDAYAISGLQPKQVRFLQAPNHLGPTHEYGVTFERGTAVNYQDRRHVYISGTASIDPTGQIVHEGDVNRQMDRTLENIEALLADAGARFGDVGVMIAYLRNPADISTVKNRLQERFGLLPIIVVHAPVCRPGWLIEIEAQAMIPSANPDFPAF